MMFVLFCQRDRNRHLDSVIALVCFSFATGKSRSVHSQPWIWRPWILHGWSYQLLSRASLVLAF